MNNEMDQVTPEPFRSLVAHQEMLKAFLGSVVFDKGQVEETLSDVNLEITRCWDQYDPSRPFGPWACGVARRVALHHSAKLKAQHALLDIDTVKDMARNFNEVGEDLELTHRRHCALRLCLRQLSVKNQELIRLRYYEDRTYAQISLAIGRAVGALRTAFFRIQKVLGGCVKQRLADSEKTYE